MQKNVILIKDYTAEEMFADGFGRTFMQDSVGHFLGLDVHVVGLRSITYKSNIINLIITSFLGYI